MDLLDQMHRTAFLGAEFLTWLWYRSELQEAVFVLDEKLMGAEDAPPSFEVWFDDKLIVGSHLVDAQENHFKGGHPTSSLEARTALRLGKLATEAKLRIVRGTQEWTLAFKAANFSLGGVKVPAVLAKEDDEKFYERMFLLEQLDQMIRGLYGQFLQVRLSEEWDTTELPSIRDWVAGEEQ
ncbi:MAG: hypothetical protein ACI9U2_002767 [Bradymonadia bacterium]|jgi:hypothetical protein